MHRGKKKNLEGFEGLIEEGGIKDKRNGGIEGGGKERQGRGVVDIGGKKKEIWEGKGEKEGGKLLRVYSTVL